MLPRSSRPLILTLVLLLAATALPTAGANAHKRNVDDNDTVVIYGNVHPLATPQNDRGPADPSQKLERMILLLKPRAGAKDSVDRLLAQLHDPSSPQYHQWLTPAEYGARFGIADDDVGEVTAWLTRGGFTIDEVASGRGWINFSGTVGQVERALKTQIHRFEVDGKMHTANAKDPQIPRGLVDLVGGVVTLHDFGRRPMNHGFKPVPMPEYTSGTSHYVAPADFAKIYN